HLGQWGDRVHTGVHTDLAGTVRGMAVEQIAGAATGDDAAARLVPAEHLRLGELGQTNGGAVDDRRFPPAHQGSRIQRPGVAYRDPAPGSGVAAFLGGRFPRPRLGVAPFGEAAFEALAQGGTGTSGTMDPRPTGIGRGLGRHPATVGVFDPRPASAWLPVGPPGAA